MSSFPNPNGQPVKLADPQKQAKLIELVRLGASLTKACACVGVEDLKTLAAYRHRDEAFNALLLEAEEEGLRFHLLNFKACSVGKGNATRLAASRHFLGCKDPEGWAARFKHDVSAAVTHKQEVHKAMEKVLSDPEAFAAAEALGAILESTEKDDAESPSA